MKYLLTQEEMDGLVSHAEILALEAKLSEQQRAIRLLGDRLLEMAIFRCIHDRVPSRGYCDDCPLSIILDDSIPREDRGRLGRLLCDKPKNYSK